MHWAGLEQSVVTREGFREVCGGVLLCQTQVSLISSKISIMKQGPRLKAPVIEYAQGSVRLPLPVIILFLPLRILML